MTFGLDHIVAPLTPDAFLAGHWPGQPFTAPTGEPRAAALERLVPELGSAVDMLTAYPDEVSLMSTSGFRASVPDGRTALPFYRAGFTCYLRWYQKQAPALAPVIHNLARQLGMPPQSLDCEIFCSLGDSGASMHSDFDINFAMLLRGSKRWRLAPNVSVVNQTTSIIIDPEASSPSPVGAVGPLPDRMPDDALTVDIGRGGVVFVPRGWWHDTRSAGESLQLNFVVNGPNHVNLLVAGMRRMLLKRPEWREFAFGCAGDEPARREQAVTNLAALIAPLGAAMAEEGGRRYARAMLDAILPVKPA